MQLDQLLPRHNWVRILFGRSTFATRLSACALPFVLLTAAAWGAAAPKPSKSEAQALFRSLPLQFEKDPSGIWTARGGGYAIGFEDSAVDLQVPDGQVRLSFEGAKRVSKRAPEGAKLEPAGKMQAPTNYFKGHTFRTADAYSRLTRRDLYPGIDVVYYGTGGQLEYDFNLAAGADPSRIRMRFTGAERVSLDKSGSLVLKTKSGDVVQQLPVVYQTLGSGELVAVAAAYKLNRDGSVGVKLGNYDRSRGVTIDPSILFDFWFTGSNAQIGVSLGHDAHGYEYMAGWTYSNNFTAGANGYKTNYASDKDCWLVKFNPQPAKGQSVIVYSTYFGGQFDDDMRSMTVDQNGVMYFGGTTLSTDIPVSSGAYATTLPNTNAILVGFAAAIDTNQAGSAGLLYSTYYGGAQELVINGVGQANGNMYVTGWTVTTDLPSSAGTPFQPSLAGNADAFLAVFNLATSGTSSLTYATYLGGTAQDVARSIDVDQNGVAYITGYTFSIDFPLTSGAFQSTYNDGGGDAFIAKVDPGSGALMYSTYVGGTGIDVATAVHVEPSGHIAIAGFTYSADFPLSINAAQPIYGGNGDAFVAVVDPAASSPATALVYGTYYGGSDVDIAYDMKRDANGYYYIAGYTFSADLPVTANAINTMSAGGGTDAFEAIIDPNNALVYASYITGPGNQVAYGVDYDASGNIYATGYATSNIFPNNTPPHQVPGSYDVFFLLVSPH